MSMSIGWARERPSKSGRRIGLFQYLRMVDNQGRQVVVGYLWYTADDLALVARAGQRLDLRVIGALRFTPDVTAAAIDETIGRVRITGPIFASDEVKRALRAHVGNGSSSEAST